MTPQGMIFPAAPWSARVRALTLLGSLILLGEAVLFLGLAGAVPIPKVAWLFRLLPWLFGATFLGCALLTVRGYSFQPAALVVHRPLWSTSIPLPGLHSAARAPHALGFTLRGFGNKGLFSILGWRHVSPYGWCRVFATDPDRGVVLQGASRNLIVSPLVPEAFIQEAMRWSTSPAWPGFPTPSNPRH